MSDRTNKKLEMHGYDAAGKPIDAPVPENADPTKIQDAILHGGGRVLSSSWIAGDRISPKGISPEEFARFNDMLASAVAHGVPMPEGINKLSRRFQGGAFNNSLKAVKSRLERGEPIKEAFDPERAKFPRLYGNLLEAGVAAGNLPQILLGLSRNIRQDAEFRRAIAQACIYPWFLIIVAIGIIGIFHVKGSLHNLFFMPYYSLQLPYLIGMRLLALVIILLGVLLTLWSGIMRYPFARPITEFAARNLPFFRGFYFASAWTSFADTLALLVRSKLPMPRALRLAGSATGINWLAALSEKIAAKVESGMPLIEAAMTTPGLPPRLLHAFENAESEDPAQALQAMAERYRRDADRQVRNMARYLPPALSIVLGLMVLGVAVLVLAPFLKTLGGAW